MKKERIVIIGAGVAGINAATELVDNGYPGELITIIDKGKDPYNRKPEEVMIGMLGSGGFSDGKLTYHTSIGGQLAKYCGEVEAYQLMDKVINNFKRFHPNPESIMFSNPQEEPDFIKPYFNLRLFPVYHIGSNNLHEIGKRWYDYLLNKGINFLWRAEVLSIDFEFNQAEYYQTNTLLSNGRLGGIQDIIKYDKLFLFLGKSGIDFAQKLIKKYNLPTEPKSVQIGVRYEAPQKYFQKLVDIAYDFKLYQRKDNVSLRSFCTNCFAAFVAVEETYGDISYNGHSLKDDSRITGMVNFGILMEIKGIENPFEWSREIVKKVQKKYDINPPESSQNISQAGLFYSPKELDLTSLTSEGVPVRAYKINSLEPFKEAYGKYADYIIEFCDDLNKVFKIGDDWKIYIPEVKYLSPEPKVNYNNLSLIQYPNVFLGGDILSGRGISVSGAQGIYCTKHIINENGYI
ncbi:MAG TPA: hypothetical protein VFV86_06985 [Nitrososphaeraceae archaeon]|nr:hypothetical protein [Nitrososphaeraceae archaeon]